MCDTLVLHDSAGKPLIFGKNSDRDPEEPQALVHIPSREPGTALIREGIEFSDKGYAMLLSKPSWMSGGEMGINSKGLAIGNEAVFSRFKPDENGVLGMDILRAALSACARQKGGGLHHVIRRDDSPGWKWAYKASSSTITFSCRRPRGSVHHRNRGQTLGLAQGHARGRNLQRLLH